ncbi:MAG: hypothetical protein Q8Q08_01895 [Candidatus Omnitrophota bacterium]|nr:hypothetical protein [Candidatus Omnitrophota bacterium]MDZ4241400.1 hypothetical protein [Candidatus Omnitrophota bacterium]
MKAVWIIENVCGLPKHFPADGKKRYLGLRALTVGEEKILKDAGFAPAAEPVFSPEDRELFLRDYVNLIGELSSEFNSRLWWATELSSKNRFNSNLPFLLQKFLTAVRAVQREDGDTLVIAGAPWEIVPSLKKFLGHSKISCRVVMNRPWIELRLLAGWLKRILSVTRQILDNLGRWAAAQGLGSRIRRSLKDGPFYCLKTFIYDSSFDADGNYKDAFFGPLVPFLEGEGKKVLIFANILGNYAGCVKKIAACGRPVIVPMEALASPFAIVADSLRALFYHVRSRKDLRFFGQGVRDIVNNELKASYCRISPYQILHYGYTKSLLKAAKIETFALTYENNPWEKMCMTALREDSPQTKIAGYQHTVVPQASANMFISKEEEKLIPRPDVVLTVGEAPKEIIGRYSPSRTVPVHAAGALRYQYLFSLPPLPRVREKKLLLALEGIFDVYHMVNYAMGQLKGSDWQVTVRTHPVLPLDAIRHKLACRPEDLPNFRLSQGTSLKEDMERSDAVMYWGSTVALEAAWAGKPVVHFNLQSVLSYDPLFECGAFKWVVTRNDSLPAALSAIHALDEPSFAAQRDSAKQYLQSYFHPVTPDSLRKFLLR